MTAPDTLAQAAEARAQSQRDLAEIRDRWPEVRRVVASISRMIAPAPPTRKAQRA